MSQESLSLMVRKLLNWFPLDEEDQAAIVALPHAVRRIEHLQHVVREGDRATHCGVLVSGFAMRQKIVGDGARQIVGVHMPGDVVDLQNAWLTFSDHGVQALTTGSMAFIPREAIQELAFSRPAVGKALWVDTLVDGSIFREWIANVGRRDARTRMAHILCEFGVRLEAVGLGKRLKYELPMTQEQLADVLGLTAVHVNRTLQGLDAEGLTKRSRRSVIISDWKRLADVGDFNSAYLHLPQVPQ